MVALCVLSQAWSLGHCQAPKIPPSESVSRQNWLLDHNTIHVHNFFRVLITCVVAIEVKRNLSEWNISLIYLR